MTAENKYLQITDKDIDKGINRFYFVAPKIIAVALDNGEDLADKTREIHKDIYKTYSEGVFDEQIEIGNRNLVRVIRTIGEKFFPEESAYFYQAAASTLDVLPDNEVEKPFSYDEIQNLISHLKQAAVKQDGKIVGINLESHDQELDDSFIEWRNRKESGITLPDSARAWKIGSQVVSLAHTLRQQEKESSLR